MGVLGVLDKWILTFPSMIKRSSTGAAVESIHPDPQAGGRKKETAPGKGFETSKHTPVTHLLQKGQTS